MKNESRVVTGYLERLSFGHADVAAIRAISESKGRQDLDRHCKRLEWPQEHRGHPEHGVLQPHRGREQPRRSA